MRPRQIAIVAVILGLTVAGFFGARALTEGDARADSERRADVAAAEVRERLEQGSSVTEGLRRFVVGTTGGGVTAQEFTTNAGRWLGPAGFPAAAWVERVFGSRRDEYEQRLQHPIVTRDSQLRIVPVGSRPSYLPATLVSGIAPMAVSGIDLGAESGVAAAMARAGRSNDAVATPLETLRDGTQGLFLVRSAPRQLGAFVKPGFVVVFVSEDSLRAEVSEVPTLRLTVGGVSSGDLGDAEAVGSTFTAAGQPFDVAVPKESVTGAAAVLPWGILVAGVVLAGLAAALGVNAARRAQAQREADRIFDLSADVIGVANFEGHFTRLNPAAEEVLGHPMRELLERPYLDFVHPDDRKLTAAEATAIAEGKPTRSFQNRYVRADGSVRVLEWTATPVVEEGLMYGVARDVTARRQAEAEAERLAGEQAALRRVATLVAVGLPAKELFEAVVREAGALLGADFSAAARFEDDGVVAVGVWAAEGEHPPVPPRWEMQPGDPATTIAETGEATRWNDWTDVPGSIAEFIRGLGIRSSVGTPIVVAGRLWGAMAIHSKRESPFPPDTEARMAQFTDLAATAIANAEARGEVERLAEEQAALRRVATLVAGGAPPNAVLDAVAAELERLLGADGVTLSRYEPGAEVTVVAHRGSNASRVPPGSRVNHEGDNVTTMVRSSERPARMEHYEGTRGAIAELVRDLGVRASVGAPIVVSGRLWGVAIANWRGEESPPPDTEDRMAQFAELLGTAIANAEARAQVERLAEEQAALRRVATLVAAEAPQKEIFGAIAEEVGRLLGTEEIEMIRFEDDEIAFTVASSGVPQEAFPVGSRDPLGGENLTTRVFRSWEPERIDYATASGPIGDAVRAQGRLRSGVGAPILVEGRLWGALMVFTTDEAPLPADAEPRLTQFTDLMATAIANAEARGEVSRLADEQAALRRVATLVAREAPQAEIFRAIAAEIGQLLESDEVRILRYEEEDRAAVVVARWGEVEALYPVGSRPSLDFDSGPSRVFQSGEPARIDDYESLSGPVAEAARATGIRATVAAPISVEGRLWGTVTAGTTRDEPLPSDSESRLDQFTELMATAIANTESRSEVDRLAEEQAALRRVATLVAEGAPPTAVFDAVAAETEALLGADRVSLSRYEADAEITVLAHRGSGAELVPPGSRLSHGGHNVQEMVRRTERPARMESFDEAQGQIADVQRTMGARGVVAVPVVVDGRVWGVLGATWVREEPPPVETEGRMAQFAGLLETAIANADARDQLTASRARLVAEGDEARRRVVQDLHDGAQQRLVHTIVTLKLAERAFGEGDGNAESLVGEALVQAQQSHEELRELAHGILPSVLTDEGLVAGVDAVAARLDLPVEVDVPAERYPAEIEASAYFIVAEALTNVVKHAHADHAEVRASLDNGMLRVEVSDDGIGGADPGGHGLVGVADRVSALGGRLEIDSPRGQGTLLTATLPLRAASASASRGRVGTPERL